MHNFPIKLDLSNFFSDERRCSLILIDITWDNVKDLQEHIQKLFNLEDISLLTADDCYVPPMESIKVIRSMQSLKAFQLHLISPNINSKVERSKKRKNRSIDEFSSSTPNLPKRSKCKNGSNDELAFGDPVRNAHSSVDCSKKQVKEKRRACTLTELNIGDLNESNTDFDKSQASISGNTTRSQSNRSTIKSSSFNKPSVSNNHIIYNDDDEEEEENLPVDVTATERSSQLKPVAQEVKFRCQLMELDSNTVRVFKLPSRKPEPIQILEEILIPARKTDPVVEKEVILPPAANGVILPPAANEVIMPPAANEVILSPAAKEVLLPPAAKDDKPQADTIVVSTGVEPVEANIEQTKTPVLLPKLPTDSSKVEQDSQAIQDCSVSDEPTHSLLDSDSDDDVMLLGETNFYEYDSDVQAVPLKDESSDIISGMLQNAAPLENLPNAGDTIIFKLPKTKGAKKPTSTTNYIVGTCSYVNRRTKTLSISLITFSDDASRFLQQYSNSIDESSDSLSSIKINYRDLTDAKVVVASVD